MDDKTHTLYCQMLKSKTIPQRVVDEWGQFKVYSDRLGTGTMQLPAYVLVMIAQRAGACPHVPVQIEVDGEVEPDALAEARVEPCGSGNGKPKNKGGRPVGSKNKKKGGWPKGKPRVKREAPETQTVPAEVQLETAVG